MKGQRGVRILSAKDVSKALSMPDAIEAMRTAFTMLAEDKVKMPIRSCIDITEHSGTVLFMPSYSSAINRICIKTITLFEDNPRYSLPLIQGMAFVFDSNTGTVIAILDAVALTAIRTGAGCGLATQLLAREDASVAAIFGAGTQSVTQLTAVCAVRPIETAFVFDLDHTRSEAFAETMSTVLNIEVYPAKSPEDALKSADVVCTATVSETPVFKDEDLRGGVHINAIGSYKPHVQEIPAETVIRSKIVVDQKEAALHETGDLIIPIQQKRLLESDIHAEIGELLTGKAEGRTSSDEITFFKSVGLAVQDLVASDAILKNAEAKNLGKIVEF